MEILVTLKVDGKTLSVAIRSGVREDTHRLRPFLAWLTRLSRQNLAKALRLSGFQGYPRLVFDSFTGTGTSEATWPSPSPSAV